MTRERRHAPKTTSLAALAALALAAACGPMDDPGADPSTAGPGGTTEGEPEVQALTFDPDATPSSLSYALSGPDITYQAGPVVASTGGTQPEGSAIAVLSVQWGDDGRPTAVSGSVNHSGDGTGIFLQFMVPLTGSAPWSVPIGEPDGTIGVTQAGAVVGASGDVVAPSTRGSGGTVGALTGTLTLTRVEGLRDDGLSGLLGKDKGTALIEGSLSATGEYTHAGVAEQHSITASFSMLERADEDCCER